MRNITVSVNEEIHRRARIRAAERGTSLSAAVREFLIAFAGGETDFERRKRLQEETLASIGRFRAGDRLSREDVHNRAIR
jgi:plasmid stability protein